MSYIYIFDIAKLIMSFFIVAVHNNPLISISATANFYLVNSLGRIPVPAFFTIAGYLLFKRINEKNQDYYKQVLKYIKKIAIIYLIWSVIYFIPYYYKNPSLEQILNFIPHIFTDGVYSQLWYMEALIIGTILTTIINKKLGIKKTLIISLILYIIGLLLVPYFPLVEKITKSKQLIELVNSWGKIIGRNGLLFGMFFITLGGYITTTNKKISQKLCLTGFILSFLCLLLETTLLRKIGSQYYGLQISLIPLTYFFIYYMLQVNEKNTRKIKTYNIRILSFLIYLSHEWIHFAYCFIISKIKLPILNNSLVSYIIIISITIILSELIIYLSKKEKFKFLKMLYSIK